MGDTFSDWQQEATPARKSVAVCFDAGLVAELEEATQALRAQEPGMLEGAGDLQERVDALRAAVEQKTRTLVFQSIGRRNWRKLLGEHPPTPEQQKEGADHNPETFPPAAMAASCAEPGLTLEQAEWIAAELPLAQYERVWGTCLLANVSGADEKKALASASLRPTEKRSRPPSSSESREAPSLVE